MSSVENECIGTSLGGSRRFAIAWRNRLRSTIHHVGVLDHDDTGYVFEYVADVDRVPDFRPFLGFANTRQRYETKQLWPLFDLRVMDRRRPDYGRYLSWLGLASDASQLDVLSRSGGEQKGDSISLVEEPRVGVDGRTEAVFLIRGSSYATRHFASGDLATRLRQGSRLDVVPDLENPVNPKAMLLKTPEGAPVGWVPDLLLPFVAALQSRGDAFVTLVQNNGIDAPWHLRLLARIEGQVVPETRLFSGDQWPRRRS